MDPQKIRNFCIVAHIDHGKSTLADRLLEFTGTISKREMRAQVLDTMDLERERGITIKAQAIRMQYKEYTLNLIDTPGHVDFSYEVSRSLAACEGALLLIDASQGIEAQTLANAYLAINNNLVIIPVINKIDLPNAEVEKTLIELKNAFGIEKEEVILASAKEGKGMIEIIEAIIKKIPAPTGDPNKPLQGLIFDSHYDSYRGVIAYVRIVNGTLKAGGKIKMMGTGSEYEALEVGTLKLGLQKKEELGIGEVGYLISGVKNVRECRVGDTVTDTKNPAEAPLPGYQPIKPMVFCGFYPVNAGDFEHLKEALEKLQLNDAALFYEPESSAALGLGFRCGFLGLLHLEIIQERLEREYNIDLVATAPNVIYKIIKTDGSELFIDNPASFPNPTQITQIEEPFMKLTVFSPSDYVGKIMELAMDKRAEFKGMEYLDPTRVMMTFQIPLSEVISEFHDMLKSCSRGYASMDYELIGYKPSDLVKMDIMLNQESVDALSIIVHREKAYHKGKLLAEKLKEVIPRHQFEIPIQATIGSKVIARETVRAIKKDVLQKCYGGDISRKRKLLEKQKAGKKRMKRIGSVDVPQEAFLAVLRLGK
ncbi:elongation factor 4 [candidate division WOR-1 bacterium RIFOXYA12_FULL_43_27]|uniref:Elongation factor 4 n=1 Tax=candidate division WOR-1 bacterium RIFOXYC2_FULL_46_14 TaxID=1802587 RepID=A0A1F4U2V9_UNCSA|nr:MAG: elongation factor 4 [candidate division WOR-1 bacterium RIFOXYA12_FULL_43_27]OGC18877.1 MAG: elongation factor 4 [candidate division WOR-1 bacterium RIFOXYB2_FULL_46_45]OGC29018.1 MAG: elongation factor 4 [candidate division WOR-1 bacterium RIFOXYA2_FULL_46_56]OGC39276.1 MAG: elongation factor 4 [candidate division WOR-1 bacterium RIFOXYC2_FULL_46_14]